MINAARLNRLQLVQQEQLNHSRKANEEAEAARQQKQFQRTKAKFDYVSSTASSGFASRNCSSGDDAEIRIHIAECSGETGRSFVYRESEALAGGANYSSEKSSGSRASLIPTSVTRKVSTAKNLNCSSGTSSCVSGGTAPLVPSYSLAAVRGSGERGVSKLGHVPRYLLHRKAELAAAKQASLAKKEQLEQEAKIPPGYRLVSDEEKARTIEEANQRLKELEVALRKIPIRFDTQNIRQKREKIEEEMEELEQAKKKYSTKRPLYVPK